MPINLYKITVNADTHGNALIFTLWDAQGKLEIQNLTITKEEFAQYYDDQHTEKLDDTMNELVALIQSLSVTNMPEHSDIQELVSWIQSSLEQHNNNVESENAAHSGVLQVPQTYASQLLHNVTGATVNGAHWAEQHLTNGLHFAQQQATYVVDVATQAAHVIEPHASEQAANLHNIANDAHPTTLIGGGLVAGYAAASLNYVMKMLFATAAIIVLSMMWWGSRIASDNNRNPHHKDDHDKGGNNGDDTGGGTRKESDDHDSSGQGGNSNSANQKDVNTSHSVVDGSVYYDDLETPDFLGKTTPSLLTAGILGSADGIISV